MLLQVFACALVMSASACHHAESAQLGGVLLRRALQRVFYNHLRAACYCCLLISQPVMDINSDCTNVKSDVTKLCSVRHDRLVPMGGTVTGWPVWLGTFGAAAYVPSAKSDSMNDCTPSRLSVPCSNAPFVAASSCVGAMTAVSQLLSHTIFDVLSAAHEAC